MEISEKIKLLNQATLESLNDKSEDAIIKKFTDVGLIILGSDYGFGWYKSEGENDFNLAYTSESMPYTPTKPRKYGINARAQSKKEPIFITDVETAQYIKTDAHQHMKGVAVVPMIYKNRTYGNIIFCYKRKHNFTPEEKSLCEAIGNGAAQSITINRLYNGLEKLVQRRTSQLKTINLKLQKDKASDDAILSSIGEGLIATDRQGVIIFTNPQALKMLGWGKDQLAGKSLYESLPLLDDKGNEVPLKQRPTYLSLYKGQRAISSTYWYVTKQKKSIPFSITSTPVKLNNVIIGSIQVFRDISQEREVDRVKTELISLASHQLRTPLSAINWYTEALVKEEMGKLNKEQKKYLQQIHHANQKMVELVYDFLNVSRIELGTFSIKLSTINITELSQSIVREIIPLINQKKLRVVEKYGVGLEKIQGDRKIIRLILQNLITNSVKYTPPKGKIQVDISVRQKKLHMIISDNGFGIPKDQQSKIFTKLFRGDNAAKLDTEGTGLGLYLVKSFVDFCKGKITFISKENKGTTFFVTLPIPS